MNVIFMNSEKRKISDSHRLHVIFCKRKTFISK